MAPWMRKPDAPLDQVVYEFDDKGNVLTLRDCFEGIFITGAPGSGKTSTSMKQLAYGLLKTPNMGGVVLTAKGEETQNWLRYCEACGRSQDVILFNAESKHRFDPFAYLWNRPGRGAADTEAILSFFSTLMTVGRNAGSQSGGGSDRFFELAVEFLMRVVITLLSMAEERISIASMHRLASSFPTKPDQHKTAEWQNDCYAASVARAIAAREHTHTPAQSSDLLIATNYAFEQWPGLDERTRSNIMETFTGLAGRFLFDPFRTLFSSGKYTWTPENVLYEHKILILDFPVLELGATGKTIQVMLKLIFYISWLRHKHTPDKQMYSFLALDEGQTFLTRRDNEFAQVARSSMVATLYATQSISNIAEALGEAQPGSRTHAYLGNFGTKIAHQQNDVLTMNYHADLIGKSYRNLKNWGGGSGSDAHVGGSEHLAYNVEPIEFSGLVKPDRLNPLAEAIVYRGGQRFLGTQSDEYPEGLNYLRTFFSRNPR